MTPPDWREVGVNAIAAASRNVTKRSGLPVVHSFRGSVTAAS